MVRMWGDKNTGDLFTDYQPPARIAPEVTKGGTLDVKIARALSHAMKGKDRAKIAVEMGDFLGGQRVTENMLDTYASPARRDHKITLERFIALAAVLDSEGLVNFVTGFAGFVAMPEKYEPIIERHYAEEAVQRLQRHIKSLDGKIGGGR